MKTVFVARATRDIQWVRRYHRSVFPEGRETACNRLNAMLQVLAAHPHANRTGVRPDRSKMLRLWATR